MKRTSALLSIFAMAILGVVATPDTSSAVPSFARQTGNECLACHYQFFPKLSAMGRAFKVGGYTDASVDLIGKEEEGLSLPANLPISFISKIRYLMAKNKTENSPKRGEERGLWNVPDEAVFYIGGRLAKNIGYSLEVAEGGWGKGSVIFMIPLGGDLKIGVDVQANDGAGPHNAMEILNTGLLRPQRGFENRSATFAAQNIGYGVPATSLGVHVASDLFFVAAGLWGPADKATTIDTGFDLALYYRAVVTPNVGGFDLAVGAFGTSGSVKCVDCGGAENTAVAELKTGAFGVDFQAQGDVAGMSLEINGSYVTSSKDKAFPSAEINAFNVGAYLGLTPAFGVKAAMMSSDNKTKKAKTDATTIGVWYLLAQNVQLAPEYTIYGGDGRSMDNRLIVLLFLGF